MRGSHPKAAGAHYTPPALADRLLAETLCVWCERGGAERLAQLKLLDPACGDGALLVPAYGWLLNHYAELEGVLSPSRRLEILSMHIHGVDLDGAALERCRARLLELAAVGTSASTAIALQLHQGDALLGPDVREMVLRPGEQESLEPFCWETSFPAALLREPAGFDVVVGNPPYVDSETLTRERPATRRYCSARYRVARGNWDLFCPFIERALSLLRPGGLHGFVVPNRLASADYAATTRALLAGQYRLRWLGDYSAVRAFAAATYPLAYAVEHTADASAVAVRCERMAQGPDGPRVARAWELDAGQFIGGRGWPLDGPELLALCASMQQRWPALGNWAAVVGGATVAEAYALEPLLNDGPVAEGDLRVLNSGTIDPFEPLWGKRAMRYLGARYLEPIVRAADLAALPPRRLKQARTPKVIVAGMTRRLECVADPRGEYLAAKSTSIVMPGDSRDVAYLAAVLNSELMTTLLRALFPGLTMAGGYLRVGPPQLRRLPLRPIQWSDPSEARAAEHIVELAGASDDHAQAQLLEAAVRTHHGLPPHVED